MKYITLTKDQIKEILESFSDGKYDHIPCPRGCCWDTKPVRDYIPDFLDENEGLLTFSIDESQIKEEEY